MFIELDLIIKFFMDMTFTLYLFEGIFHLNQGQYISSSQYATVHGITEK